MDGVFAIAEILRPGRGADGDLRCPQWAARRERGDPDRRELAEMPGRTWALCFSLRPHLDAQDGGLLIDRLGAVTGEYAHGRFPDHFYVTRVRGNGLDLVAGLFEGFVHIVGGAGFLAGNLQEADFGEEDLSVFRNGGDADPNEGVIGGQG